MDKKYIIDAIKTYERDHADFSLSVTIGHVLVHHKTLEALPYEGELGVKNLLDYLVRLNWEPIVSQDGVLVGVKKDKEEVHLGAGAQINWMYRNFIHINELEQAYLGFVELLFEELKRREEILLATGHQPVTPVEQIQPLPTQDTVRLLEYAQENNGLKEYLLSSATMTVSMQFAHSDNFQKRMQSAFIIQPALAALFDNVSWVNGQPNDRLLYNLNSLAEAPDRYYKLVGALDDTFKYQEFADFLAEAPAIVHGEGPVDQTIGACYEGRTFTKEDLIRHMSLLRADLTFTDDGVALANIDSVPYPLNMAYVLMVKALLYNPDHITALDKVLEDMKDEKLLSARADALQKGLEGKLGDGTLFDLIKDLFFMIMLTVEPTEQHYLQPLNSLLFKGVHTKEVGKRQFQAIVENE